MQLNLSFLKNNKEKSFHKKSSHLSPSFYWMVVFFSSVFLTAVFIFLGNFMFRDLNTEKSLDVKSNNKNSLIVKKERIDKILSYFKLKETKSEEIINSSVSVIDPSL